MNGLLLFEDEHLLAVNKPSGINTHRPDRHAPEGLHEYLQRHLGFASVSEQTVTAVTRSFPERKGKDHRLAVLHRLDKETSGVLIFGKSRLANQALARQFSEHSLRKTYLLLAARRPTRARFVAHSPGAETEFEYGQSVGDHHLVVARPVTGKTHQIRQHAAENGFPILGDLEYEGAPAPRVMLHAYSIEFQHPVSGERMRLEASVPDAFAVQDPLAAAREFRVRLFAESGTNCYRLVNGAADGVPDVAVDWYDDTALVQWQREVPAEERLAFHKRLRTIVGTREIYDQLATRRSRTTPQVHDTHPCPLPPSPGLRRTSPGGESDFPPPEGAGVGLPVAGPAPRFCVQENGLQYLIRLGEGFSSGLFLDQRENRWRLLGMPLEGKTVLNCFAYTCAFSVVAARAGAVTTSVDLSRNYLDWGRENMRLNGIDPERHDFVHGDVFEWLTRFAKRGRRWDLVLLDPPTFSTTKQGRRFQAERDYAELVRLALAVVLPGGWLFCSTNQRTFAPASFEAILEEAVKAAGRGMAAKEYVTQPFDFRPAPGERPYLKTCWIRLAN